MQHVAWKSVIFCVSDNVQLGYAQMPEAHLLSAIKQTKAALLCPVNFSNQLWLAIICCHLQEKSIQTPRNPIQDVIRQASSDICIL